MKKQKLFLVSWVLLTVIILSACGAPAATVSAPMDEKSAGVSSPSFEVAPVQGQDGSGGAPAEQQTDQSGIVAAPPAQPEYGLGEPENPALAAAGHMIIKNADLKLLVKDTDVAIDRATQIAGDLGGYIISSRAWYQTYYDEENYKYATLTIGVPVGQFERALTRLKDLSIRVLDETASGEDVTDQYVDLEAQLANLEATRERIKSFLDQAQTVDEALRINQQLSDIERQIEQIKGQINYLSDRSSFSTITVNFEPELPEIKPEPTPTPSPWDPGETFKHAKETVTRAYQGIVDFLIWFFIVIVPILLPPALIVWILWRVLKRRAK